MSGIEIVFSGVIGGTIGASLGALTTARFNLKSGRALLLEKWMQSFRESVSTYLGILEKVRYGVISKPIGFELQQELEKLHSSKVRVNLHLKSKKDPPKIRLCESRSKYLIRQRMHCLQVEIQNLLTEIEEELVAADCGKPGTTITRKGDAVSELAQEVLAATWHDVEDLMKFDLEND